MTAEEALCALMVDWRVMPGRETHHAGQILATLARAGWTLTATDPTATVSVNVDRDCGPVEHAYRAAARLADEMAREETRLRQQLADARQRIAKLEARQGAA